MVNVKLCVRIINRAYIIFIDETTRPQAIRNRWQETSYETRDQQNPEGVLVIRVPEPEIIGSHPHLEILHEANIKPMQREPLQTEKGAAMSNCALPGEITSTIELIYMPYRNER